MTPRPIEPREHALEPAIALAREGRFEEAVAALQLSVRAQRGRPTREAAVAGLTRISRMSAAAGDQDSALRAIESALRMAPSYADLHYQRACLLIPRGERAEARRALERAVEINPKFVAARIELALLDAHEGLVGESLQALRRLAEEVRLPEPRAFQRGLESLEQADWEAAATLLRGSVQRSDAELDRQLEQVRTLLDQGQPAHALRLLREALDRNPGYPDLHYMLGTTELTQGHLDDALMSLARALELRPSFHAARVQLARVLEALGQNAQAEEQVALVLELDTTHAEARELAEHWESRRRRPGAPRNARPKAS